VYNGSYFYYSLTEALTTCVVYKALYKHTPTWIDWQLERRNTDQSLLKHPLSMFYVIY